ncbi:DUF2339 domain-containing protein [Candidatus Latescibacterota bacterium]
MNEHEDSSLHKRVEDLEHTVNELQRRLSQIADSGKSKSSDSNSEINMTFPIQDVSAYELNSVLAHPVPEKDDDLKQCPFCNKMIKMEALKCRYCRSLLPETHESSIDDKKVVITEEPSKTHEEWEAFIGGKILNRIGALALIIAIGFFLKYSFDNNWINETMRVLIGIIVGIGLLLGGARFHSKGLPIFAQGLVGAGLPILYLSVYASFNFYHLVSQTTAFVLMSLVTITAIQQAVKYDSFAVSFLGWAGGFLTPFLLSTGEVNAVGLLSYILLLDAGLLAVVSAKKSWEYLELLTLAATYIVYILWYGNHYSSGDMPVAIIFISIVWSMFCALDIFRIKWNDTSVSSLSETVSVANGVLFYLSLYSIIEPEYHSWMAPSTLLIGICYFLTFLWTIKRHADSERNIVKFAYSAVVLIVIATNIQFSSFPLVIAWSIEAFVLFWCGIRFNLKYIVEASLGLFSISLAALMANQLTWDYSNAEQYALILNQRFLTFSLLIASLGGSILMLRKVKDHYFDHIKMGIHYVWCLLVFQLCTVETVDFVELYDMEVFPYIMVIVWMVYSLPLVLIGLKQKLKPLLACGIGTSALILVLVAVKSSFVFEPIETFVPVWNIRVFTLLIIIAGLFVQAYRVKKSDEAYDWTKYIPTIYLIAMVVLGFIALTVETRDYFGRAIVFLLGGPNAAMSINNLSNMLQLSLSAVWLMYSIFLMGIGMKGKIQGFRLMSIALFGITIIKIFIYDLSFLDSLFRIFSFMGLGIILLLVSYFYQRYKSVIFGNESINEK